jgi:hypothetical protein
LGKQIEHDADEPPRDRTGNWPYWLGLALLMVLWIGNLLYVPLNWNSVALGAITGGGFVGFMMEYTGNRLPRWMR